MCTVIVLPLLYCCYFSNTFHLLEGLSEGTAFLFNFTKTVKFYIKFTHTGFKINSATNKNVRPFLFLHIFHKLYRTLDPSVSVDKVVSSVGFY